MASGSAAGISSDESELSGENDQSLDENEEPVTPGSRRRRSTRLENYMGGKSQKAYWLHEDLAKSVEGSPPVMEGVCSMCQQWLTRIAEGFNCLRHQGTELKKRMKILPHPKHPDRTYYRNTIAQNEWLRANVFDSMGNCFVKNVSPKVFKLAKACSPTSS